MTKIFIFKGELEIKERLDAVFRAIRIQEITETGTNTSILGSGIIPVSVYVRTNADYNLSPEDSDLLYTGPLDKNDAIAVAWRKAYSSPTFFQSDQERFDYWHQLVTDASPIGAP